ncbi:uncharacterized protein UTRI_02740_B [Ustilago trichophora]|uniref:CLASP N-terminal domain-containing protein n=1 Tax=Ustilago trichophora TaxID=86804 RepID=A0A5C3E505_9BASI|nr:uncharacterized protein UTRI_02740_B [Ustilago trichophora]
MPSKPNSQNDAKINITSAVELHAHFDEIHSDLHSPETEHTWQKIQRALLHIHAITRGGATKFTEFVSLLKQNATPINNSLLSERTKLSGTAGDLLNSIAPRLAERFEGLVAVFVPTLLLICARTNKVAVKRAEKSLHFVVKHCRPPAVVAYLKEAIRDKGQGLRAVAAGTLVLVLEHTEKDRLARRVGDIEACIKSGATDSNPEVRQTTKRLFELYVAIWPERVEGFTKPMTPTIRRYLSLPKTGALHVEVLPLTAAVAVAAPPTRSSNHTSSSHSNRHEEVPMSASHASQTSRNTPAYNFFPDLKKSSSSSSSTTSSSAARMPSAPGFSVNDATYVKRGLFAEQIAAARNARLARVPSFNFDDVARNSSEIAPVQTMKRQPSFEQLRSHGTTAAAAAAAAPHSGTTFRVPRFEVVPSRSDSDGGRPWGGHGDINANTPAFAAASGLHGKSALLAAYKQAFVGEVPSAAKPPSSSRERHHQDRSEKPSKNSDKRRENTITVRFEPELEDKENEHRHASGASDEIRRSRSAPQIAIQSNAGIGKSEEKVVTPTDVDREQRSSKLRHTDEAEQKTAIRRAVEDVDSDEDEDENERPSTPPERMLHAQTPRTGIKASRVPAQRVAMPSAAKVSAMRVAVPTPSAKIAASRVMNVSESVESSPVPKTRVEPRTPRAVPAKAEAAPAPAPAVLKESQPEEKDVNDKADKVEEKEAPKSNEASKEQQTVVKKPATSVAQTAPKQVARSVPIKAAPSASLAAKARLEARTAKSATATAITTAESKKVVSKTATAVSKPVIVRKPINSSTTTTRPTAKPIAPAASIVKTTRPASAVKPSAATSTATARAKLAASSKPTTTTAPSATLAATKKVEAPSVARTSRLTASTASTRNKIVPAASVKKFQPTKPSSLVPARQKSSIAASLTAKSKLVGAQSAATDKTNAVRKASATMAARIEKHRRISAAGVPSLPTRAPAVPAEPIVADAVIEPVEAPEVVDEIATEKEPSTTKTEEEVGVQAQKPEETEAIADKMEGAVEAEVVSATDEAAADPIEEATIDMIQPLEPASEQAAAARFDEEASVALSQTEAAEQEEFADAEEVSSTRDIKVVAEEKEGQAQSEAVEPASCAVTPIKLPILAENTTPARVRTPLSCKDTNLPKVTPLGNVTMDKTASPISSVHLRTDTRSTPVPSPLRHSATPKTVLRLPQYEYEPESSFEESEDEMDEVVQLAFRPHPITQDSAVRSPAAKLHKVVLAHKQLVLGVDSSDDASMEANENDETVLLEEQVA